MASKYPNIPSDVLEFFVEAKVGKKDLGRMNAIGEKLLGTSGRLTAFASLIPVVRQGTLEPALAILEHHFDEPDGRSIEQVCAEIDTLNDAVDKLKSVFAQ